MCHRYTQSLNRVARAAGLLAVGGVVCLAQTTLPGQADTAWHRVGTTTVDRGLAGPASGAVTKLWYRGGTLLARTASGRVFESAFDAAGMAHWRMNTAAIPPAGAEGAARLVAVSDRLYAAGADNLYVSRDGGAAWVNLTAFDGASVIGAGLAAVAVAPGNPDEVTVATGAGVWRSLDGGLSWRGLNEELPNLAVRRLLDRKTVLLQGGMAAQLAAGGWSEAKVPDAESALRARFAQGSGAAVTAAAQTGGIGYAGTADGRLLASRDGGANWTSSGIVTPNAIARIWVDAERPESALAASGGVLLRTVNGGLFWDDVTGALGAGQIHGVTADRAAGVVYAATERGVYAGDISLNDAGRAAAKWRPVSPELPAAAAWDVLLNADGTLTAALDGYGVYEAVAPHRARAVRVVSGADLTDRAAAPGSLISVLGAKIERVQGAGTSYPVLAATEQSSQVQVPFTSAAGSYQLVLEGAAGRWTVPLTVKDSAPAIFVDGEGAPLVLDAMSGLVMDPGVALRAESTVQLLATGLGRVTPEWPAGVPAPLESPPRVAGAVQAFLDGTPVEVTNATLAPGYTGYYIVELRIPSIVNRGASELRIVMNGEESNRVKVYLEPGLLR